MHSEVFMQSVSEISYVREKISGQFRQKQHKKVHEVLFWKILVTVVEKKCACKTLSPICIFCIIVLYLVKEPHYSGACC